ncbi:hypothetical protein PCASD_17113 [Puccinia coronata f. sp. avenae]|uniref:Uncharacterized protein n=1 Tax=Puccinia coronata f. sp. avenae TaxID=200324 RepID=A0A2N5T5B6_9BASI|nr:hypothetical protein PCASD_17113 [Puccinia coronata f. sp. avenae]
MHRDVAAGFPFFAGDKGTRRDEVKARGCELKGGRFSLDPVGLGSRGRGHTAFIGPGPGRRKQPSSRGGRVAWEIPEVNSVPVITESYPPAVVTQASCLVLLVWVRAASGLYILRLQVGPSCMPFW